MSRLPWWKPKSTREQVRSNGERVPFPGKAVRDAFGSEDDETNDLGYPRLLCRPYPFVRCRLFI